ncbi:MAG: A24 family peptidase C-terminal domain-containing protein [Methanoculleaceae archaeon]
MINPLVVSAAAIGATLIYGSIRDIRERRLPHRTWRPSLIIAVPAAILVYSRMLWGPSAGGALVSGASVLTAAVAATAADAWLWRRNEGAWPDRDALLSSFFLFLAVAVPAVALLFSFFHPAGIYAGLPALLACLTAGLLYAMARLNLFGGADAYALIVITACIPVYPVVPLCGLPYHGFFPVSVLVNGVLSVLVVPVVLLAINLARGERGPLTAMLLGFRVPGDRIRDAHGFIMEDLWEQDGEIRRRYIGIRDAIRRMMVTGDRIYTDDLRERPEDFRELLDLYRRAGSVWISYGVPFLVPVTAGFFSALFIGDFFDILFQILLI